MSAKRITPEALAKDRLCGLARQRALARLAAANPEAYETLLAEERTRLGLAATRTRRQRPDRP